MTTNHVHTVRLQQPFFEDNDRASLLRYLDSDFIGRFQLDIRKNRYADTQSDSWMGEERHSPFDDKPVLRLPIHRTFHLICCEVICERFGSPALDPAHIHSAGFVIRRIKNRAEKSWLIEDGEPIGWQDTASEFRDPDFDRRFCPKGHLRPYTKPPLYNGEEIHPLHILESRDAKGKAHTLLYGYVPLGGSYYERSGKTSFDEKDQKTTEAFVASGLPYPFGYREGKNSKWKDNYSQQIIDGKATTQMFELLQLLVNRYHLGESGIEENERLEQLFSEIWFYDEVLLKKQMRTGFSTSFDFRKHRSIQKLDLTRYLRDCFSRKEMNPLVKWLIEQEEKADKAGGIENLSKLDPLPDSSGTGELSWSLSITSSDAESIRYLLGQRYRDQSITKANELPLPKFSQEKDDVYQIVPFIRYRNKDGREYLQWGATKSRSIEFRVASPFDPEASRPSLIQMPGLRDLKRGLAQGASMIIPGDTFDMIKGLNLKKGAGEDVIGTAPKNGIQWICSFSLPVITLVAMILLMIMISLLNIVFFWLPWVRICFPFPKKDE